MQHDCNRGYEIYTSRKRIEELEKQVSDLQLAQSFLWMLSVLFFVHFIVMLIISFTSPCF